MKLEDLKGSLGLVMFKPAVDVNGTNVDLLDSAFTVEDIDYESRTCSLKQFGSGDIYVFCEEAMGSFF